MKTYTSFKSGLDMLLKHYDNRLIVEAYIVVDGETIAFKKTDRPLKQTQAEYLFTLGWYQKNKERRYNPDFGWNFDL